VKDCGSTTLELLAAFGNEYIYEINFKWAKVKLNFHENNLKNPYAVTARIA